MFKTISRLLFGGEEEETPEHIKPRETVEEGWTVVTHQEAHSAESQDTLLSEIQPSNSALHGHTATNMEADCVPDAEPSVQSSTTTSQAVAATLFQPKALPAVTQFSCVQKAKSWADRHYVSRNAIQRQNRIRQGVQHSFHLQQPGHRSLGH